MGLRNSNTQNEDKMVNEIREAIAMCRLSPANQKIADEFFDFSNEMDTSLLEQLQYQNMDKMDWECRTKLDRIVSALIHGKEEETTCEYRNRLILFLDAVGKDSVAHILFDARSQFDYYKESPKAQKRLQVIYDVLSKRYEKHMVAAKIYSLFLHLGSYSESTMVNALSEFYQHMKIEYAPELCMAARYCSENLVQKYLMLAAAFSSENCAAYKDEEEVQFALAYIREFMKNTPKRLFEKERVVGYAAAFAASEFDESLLEDLAELDIRVGTLLNAFIYYLPKEYLERRMDVVCRLLQVEENSDKVYENTTLCMQAMLVHLGYDDRNGYESETRDIFYKKMIQNCPKAVVDVIRCENPVKKEFGAYTKGMFFANAYERMYQLIGEEKKEVLSTYQMDFDTDVLKLASNYVFNLGDKKQTKVLSYLLGNCDLEQALEAVLAWAQAYNSNRANHDIVTCCERINKGFAARYASFMVMVTKSYLRECWYSNKKKEEIMNMPELFMREKVPVEKRFQAYADLFDETYMDMTEWYDSVKDFMIKYAEEYDADYEKYVKDAPVVVRRWYTEYLGFAKNIPNKKERLLAMCGDSFLCR